MSSATSRSNTGRRIACGFLLATAALVQGCGAATPASPHAGAVVNALYRDHFADGQNWERTYQRRRALFAPGLRALLDADARASAANADEVVGLDFDPLTDAQEEMTSFQVAPAALQGDAATIGVVLLLDTARTNVRVQLARSNQEWQVANLQYAHGDLVSLLHRLAADRQRAKP
jgi:Protein of unknown function (DUF3828)